VDAVQVRVAALVRRGWTATIAIALLVGLGAGVAMAATSAGRRTATAFDRLVAHVRPPAFNITFCPPGVTEVDEESILACFTYVAADEVDVIADLPEVADVAYGEFRGATAADPAAPDDPAPVSVIAIASGDIQSFDGDQLIVEGRWYRHDRSEVVVNQQFHERTGLGVGDEVTLTFWAPDELGVTARPGQSFTGPATAARIVGVSRGLVDLGQSDLPPALLGDDARAYGGRSVIEATGEGAGFGGVFVRPTAAGEATLLAAIEAALPGRPFNATPSVGEDERAPISQAMRYEANGLLAVGALMGLAALVFAAQAVARQSRREWADVDILRAVGYTSGQVWSAAALRGSVIGVTAAAVAVGTCIALSPLGPIGLARLAEPDPGVHVDAVVLVVGAGLVVLTVVASCWAPVRRLGAAGTRAGHPTRFVGAPAWLPPPVRAGLGMGRSRRGGGLPLGTAVASVALAAGAVAASTGLTASLDALQASPERYGVPWDVSIGGVVDASYEDALEVVREHPDVVAAGALVGTDASIGAHSLWVHAFTGVPGIDGRVQPPITSGRAPAAVDEIALGAVTMRELDLAIGDQVEIQTTVTESAPTRLTVVGTTMINDVYEQSPGRGGVVSVDWVERAAPEVAPDPYVVRLAEGADVEAFRTEVAEVFAGTVIGPVPQTAVRNVARLREFPFALTAAVGALAMAALVHALVLSVRRHGRQLAILQSLGFTRRQVAGVVVSHATVLALAAALIGLPLGVVLGRWGWRMIAQQIGVVDVSVTPLLPLLATLVGVVVAANLAAVYPAWRAQRTEVAEALHAE
jgi:hypothetical protein